MRRVLAWPIAVWLRLQEPRAVTFLHTLIYGVCALGGLSTILDPPTSIESAYGPLLTYTWGAFALLGGILGAASCPTGRWMIEKPAIILCATATVIYAGIVLSLHLTSAGNRLTQVAFILMALLNFIARYARIRPFSYEPGK